jgi:hypothetical protein
MKKRMILLTVVLFVSFIFSSCGQKPENSGSGAQSGTSLETLVPEIPKTEPPKVDTPKVEKVIKIGWDFEVKETQDGTPLTRVFLKLSGDINQKIDLGEYNYNFNVVTPETCQWEFPKDSITQCFGWWAGEGTIIGVVREADNKLVVKHKLIWESGGDSQAAEELAKEVFKNLKTIEIESASKVEAEK